MEISTSKNELQTALQKLSKAVPSRSTLPILSCVLIEAREAGTQLRTTDLEITIVVSMPASISTSGAAAIPMQTLLDITSELPDETRITLAVDAQNKVEIKTEMGEYDIMGKPAEEFPALPEVDNRKATGISSPILKDIISKTGFAVSRDELKPALTGVLFRFGKDELTSVATDGHRLVRYIIKDYKTLDFTGDVIVPRKFLNLLSNALTGQESTQMWLGENHLTAAIGEDSYFTRIIDERYPDYQSVIPENNEKKLEVERKDILSAVRRVSIFSNKATKQIALRLTQEKTLVTTEDPEKSSKAQEELQANFEGEDIVVGYNAQYLKDILSHLDSDSITINLKTPISAALFYPAEQQENSDLTMLLMPIRLND